MPPKKPLPGRSALAGILDEMAPSKAAAVPVSVPVNPRAAPLPPQGDMATARRILAAREPAALVELDAGLLEAAKGEAALAAWLARPVTAAAEVDTLSSARVILGGLTEMFRTLPKGSRNVATISNAISTLSKTIEKLEEKRPPKPTTSEVDARLKARADDCVDLALQHTREAAKLFAKGRAALEAWEVAHLGPEMAKQHRGLVAAMLGEDEKE